MYTPSNMYIIDSQQGPGKIWPWQLPGSSTAGGLYADGNITLRRSNISVNGSSAMADGGCTDEHVNSSAEGGRGDLS